jgi:hypothetical protein
VTQIRVVVDQDEPCHCRPSLAAGSNVHRTLTTR